MTLPTGTRLSGYEIVRPIGAGGMGEVYRARDTKLGRDVAIKVLPAELASDKRRLERFEKEARASSALNHPSIVTVYDIGADNGTSFIAMELIDGKTLREILEAGPVPMKRLLPLAAQASDGLAKAHAAGIVHRDLKPENLMVTRDGFVKILDFGLAKLSPSSFEAAGGAERTMTRVTEAGTILGTVGYMSPEQASGQPADFRSDQFSFGSILYEMATGKRAFHRSTDAQTLSAIIESDPEPLASSAPKLPTGVLWVVERCLAKDPEDRYGSTKDLARDLAMLRDQSSGASAPGVAPPERRRVRLSKAGLALAALAVIGLAALAFLVGQRAQARTDRRMPPPKRMTLTFRRGFLTGARFAPDGQSIVYSAAWDGKPSAIFTTRVGSTVSRPLGIENAAIYAVSSTGEMALAVDCNTWRQRCHGTLALAPLAGGAPREVLQDVVSADWSPDGKDLAVLRGVGASVEYPIGKVLYQTQGYLSSIRVSPDGERVAFVEHPRLDSSRGILTVVDRAGKAQVLAREWLRVQSILWSPKGDEVFYSRWGSREIRGASLSGRIRIAPWIPSLDDVSREGLFLDTGVFLDNFRSVILGGSADGPEINLSWLTSSTSADLSPDGEQLLFYEEGVNLERPDQEVFTTYLRGTDGSDAIPLGEGRALALSPDKAWALVVRQNPQPHLALLSAGAEEPKTLPSASDLLYYRRAAFFPDGKRILFLAVTKEGGWRSFIQDLAGGPPKQFGEDSRWATVVSPDGRDILGGEEGTLEIYPVDGGRPRPLRGGVDGDIPFQWSSDGKIYVRGTEDLPLTLYRIDPATGRRERWKELAPAERTGFLSYAPTMVGLGVSISRDGRTYAYSYLTDMNRLVLIDVGPDWWK